MDFASIDLVLAVAHHLLIFALAAILAFEVGIVRSPLGRSDIQRLARVDIWYGVLAGAILAVGFSRAIFAAKGWDYYSHNLFFWAKLGAFAVVGGLSVAPTLAIIRWRRALAREPVFLPQQSEIARIRRVLWLEVMVFALIPAFAAAMARGYGEWTS